MGLSGVFSSEDQEGGWMDIFPVRSTFYRTLGFTWANSWNTSSWVCSCDFLLGTADGDDIRNCNLHSK